MVFRDDRRQQGPPQLLEDMTALCTGRSSPYPYTGCGCTTGRGMPLPPAGPQKREEWRQRPEQAVDGGGGHRRGWLQAGTPSLLEPSHPWRTTGWTGRPCFRRGRRPWCDSGGGHSRLEGLGCQALAARCPGRGVAQPSCLMPRQGGEAAPADAAPPHGGADGAGATAPPVPPRCCFPPSVGVGRGERGGAPQWGVLPASKPNSLASASCSCHGCAVFPAPRLIGHVT